MYARSVFPGVWKKIEDAIREGILWIAPEVVKELAKREDEIAIWAKEWAENNPQQNLFLQNESKQKKEYRVKALAGLYPKATSDKADIHIIAWAECLAGSVVTQENERGSIKIPNICDRQGIGCMSLLGMMKELGWKFN